MNWTRALTTAVTALTLLVPSTALLWVGSPKPWAPLPVVFVFPAFNGVYAFALLYYAIGFIAAVVPLLRGKHHLPWYAVAGCLILGSMNTAWLLVSWSYGIEWQGVAHTWIVVSVNLLFYVVLGVLMVRARRRASFHRTLAFYWLLFLWLAWYSFPYLGELP